MGVSQFPAAAGGGLSNDFILDKADSTNNTFTLPREFEAGGYAVTLGSGDTSYDIYLLNAAGSTVGYTNDSSIVASEAFAEVVVLGVGTAETITFQYNGPSTDASSQGLETGAGAYLVSVTPSDMPQIDDTTTVLGGNFASGVEFAFISGTVVKAAKNVVVGSSTAAVVTRPDDLIEDLAPYDLRAINPGVTPPTGSDAHILAGTITAGTDPSFVTTSPILGAALGSAFSSAILTSDSEGSVVLWEVTAGTVPTGLTLGTADGVLAGTPSAEADYYFTVRITDDGGNTNEQEFNMPVGLFLTAAQSTAVGGTTYYWFDSSDDLSYVGAGNFEYLVIAGGAGGGNMNNSGNFGQPRVGGGGGAGGVLFGTATVSGAGTAAVVVGAGGATGVDGTDSYITGFATATGGGLGGRSGVGGDGGSGGGGGYAWDSGTTFAGGTGISGQGFDGATSSGGGGGGGGAGEAGNTDGNRTGGDGADYGAWASAVGIIYNGGYFGGGGTGGIRTGTTTSTDGGIGGGGKGGNTNATAGSANSGGGGGGAGSDVDFNAGNYSGAAGGSGLVIVRVS